MKPARGTAPPTPTGTPGNETGTSSGTGSRDTLALIRTAPATVFQPGFTTADRIAATGRKTPRPCPRTGLLPADDPKAVNLDPSPISRDTRQRARHQLGYRQPGYPGADPDDSSHNLSTRFHHGGQDRHYGPETFSKYPLTIPHEPANLKVLNLHGA